MESNDLRALSELYLKTVYEAKAESPEEEEEKMKKDDDLAGSPNKKKNGKKADKDYDGDGKVESGTAEYMGSKDKAIKKAMKKEAYTVTNADKKGNTPAYQGYKSGKKGKDGKPLYKAADHLKDDVEISSEVEKLIESGKFTEQEIEALIEAERKLADRLARKRKVYDKTTKKAMQFARDEGEASGHARYRMSSISREMDGIKAKMNKEK